MRMRDHLDQIHSELAQVKNNQIEMRTELRHYVGEHAQIKLDLKPLKAHVDQTRGAVKLIAVLASLAAIIGILITLR